MKRELYLARRCSATAIRNACFPPHTGLADSWEMLSYSSPAAVECERRLVRYIGTELSDGQGPVIREILVPALLRYNRVARESEDTREMVFLLGVRDAIRKLPRPRITYREAVWSLGDTMPLPKWLRRKPRECIAVEVLGRPTDAGVTAALRQILDPYAFWRVRKSGHKIVHLARNARSIG